MDNPRSIMIRLAAAILTSAALAGSADAGMVYGFGNITGNDVVDAAAGESQLTVEVLEAGPGLVSFLFRNIGPDAMSITDVYFDDGTLLGIASLSWTGDVSFSQGAAPPDLPGGDAIGFETTAGFLADSDTPIVPNGVNPGETLTITFDLLPGYDVDDVNAALASVVDLRIGIHVQGFVGGGSEAFVNNPNPIPSGIPGALPEPGSIVLFGIGIVGLASRRRWHKADPST